MAKSNSQLFPKLSNGMRVLLIFFNNNYPLPQYLTERAAWDKLEQAGKDVKAVFTIKSFFLVLDISDIKVSDFLCIM